MLLALLVVNSVYARIIFLFYVAGDNDLAGAAQGDWEELKSGYESFVSSTSVVVKALVDEGYHPFRGILDGTKEVVEGIDQINTGDPDEFLKFLEWGLKDVRDSDRVVLVIWNHGTGWITEPGNRVAGKVVNFSVSSIIGNNGSDGVDSFNAIRAIAYDFSSRDSLSLEEIKDVFRKIRKKYGIKIDVFGMDACYMGMIEVFYQFRNYTKWQVASELPELSVGWDYYEIMEKLGELVSLKGDRVRPSDIAKTFVDVHLSDNNFENNYYYNDVSLVAVNSSKLVTFRNKLEDFAKLLLENVDVVKKIVEEFKHNRDNPLYLPDSELAVDLKRLLDIAGQKFVGRKEIDSVKEAMKKLFYGGWKGTIFNGFGGLSITLPSGDFDEGEVPYKELDFANVQGKLSSWAKLVYFLKGDKGFTFRNMLEE